MITTARPREERTAPSPILLAWWTALAVGVALLGTALFEVGPSVIGRIGAVVVSSAYTWRLAVRTGGRPVVFTGLAVAAGVVVLVWDRDDLRTGAAVLTAALAAVLAVMATVPARRFVVGVRELLLATAIAGVGSLAAVGFEPVADFSRFQYAVTALALIFGFYTVYRLGAGLHGLGKRGLVVVVVGFVVLTGMLLYAEMIRRYGSNGLVDGVHETLAWSRENLNGYPRPIQALLGVPALVYGTHMRARRRQGWWVCAFGVAYTATLACTLVNPDPPGSQALASLGYSLVVGVVIGFLLIRIDVLFTGTPVTLDPKGEPAKRAGRRAARGDDATAVRPEPTRMRPLL